VNKEKIQTIVNEFGLTIGCYDKMMDSLSNKDLNEVLKNLAWQNDTDVKIRRKDYVVEIDIVDGEVDFSVLSKAEYIDRYGDERYDQ
jgi:hypothetical protein